MKRRMFTSKAKKAPFFALLVNIRRFISLPDLFSLAPTHRLWVSDDIVFTNKRLAKIGYVPHDTCTFCKVETETIYHLFYECPFTLLFWENFENFWFVLSCKREKFTLQDVYIGKLAKCELLNYLITLAKLHIWQSRKEDKIPECEVFLKQVDVKYRTEKYIAVTNNTQKKFQAKWLLYRWHLYLINISINLP